jgi:large subunit ribosomal protein L4
MPSLQVLNQQGKKLETLAVSDYVFGIEPHQQALYDIVLAQRAAMRQGTADTKNRSEVRGGGKKPWRQKGTGRARQGSIRSPQWRKGGIVFGPTPRSYRVKFNQKVRQLALRSALSYQVLNNQFIVVDSVAMEDAKTKNFQAFLTQLNVTGKVLVIATSFGDNEALAARNIPTVQFATADHVSVYDLLNAKFIVATKDAVKAFEEVLKHD